MSEVDLTSGAMPQVVLGKTELRVSVIGLGCSRLGSTLAATSRKGATRLVHHALSRGVTLFDTANIYGQGDSEKVLGFALGKRRSEVVLVTKAGQRFTTGQRIATLLKGPIRMASAHSPMLRSAVGARRAARLPRDFSSRHIERALKGSLKRLRTDWLDLFLLHSPDVDDVREGNCYDLLNRLQEQGIIRNWGISCDDLATAEAALNVPGVSALQVPLLLVEAAAPLVAAAAAQHVALLVREVFAKTVDGFYLPTDWRDDRIAAALVMPNAAALIGTTQPRHLDEAVNAVLRPNAVTERRDS